MTATFLEKIDWSRPWLAHVRAIGESIAQAPDWRAELNRRATQSALRNQPGLPIQFVPQADLPADVAYETCIHETGCVPTRENLHDFFNALIWLTFPHIKAQLNSLQAREIQKALLSSASLSRGKVRDAATIFDENAVLLVSSNKKLVEALRLHAWTDVFLKQRDLFVRDCRVLLFGHALMEKLIAPYKSITGHMWVHSEDYSAMPAADCCRVVDRLASKQLIDGLSTRDFSPLPILGVPGWWDAQDSSFYFDVSVFRPKRISH